MTKGDILELASPLSLRPQLRQLLRWLSRSRHAFYEWQMLPYPHMPPCLHHFGLLFNLLLTSALLYLRAFFGHQSFGCPRQKSSKEITWEINTALGMVFNQWQELADRYPSDSKPWLRYVAPRFTGSQNRLGALSGSWFDNAPFVGYLHCLVSTLTCKVMSSSSPQ